MSKSSVSDPGTNHSFANGVIRAWVTDKENSRKEGILIGDCLTSSFERITEIWGDLPSKMGIWVFNCHSTLFMRLWRRYLHHFQGCLLFKSISLWLVLWPEWLTLLSRLFWLSFISSERLNKIFLCCKFARWTGILTNKSLVLLLIASISSLRENYCHIKRLQWASSFQFK